MGARENVRFPGIGIIGGYEPPDVGSGELYSRPLQAQSDLLVAELSLWPMLLF